MKKLVRLLIASLLITSLVILLPAAYSQTEEYYAVISDLSYPPDVDTGKKISVTVTVDYKLPAGTVTLFVEAFDEQDNTLDALAEEEKGEGSGKYTLSFDAPSEQGVYGYYVITYYVLGDDVDFNDDGKEEFTINVLTPSGSGVTDIIEQTGIPGFQPLALMIGLVTIALMLNTKPRKYH